MRISLKLTCLVSALGMALLLVLLISPLSLATAQKRGSDTVIACFHKKISRFSALAHPKRCDFRGYRGKKVAEIPVEGMKWGGHWGAKPARAAFGVDVRDGTPVRVVAYRPVPCADGR